MKVEFQYDPKRKEVRIVSEFFKNIKEHFSVKNEAARFNKYARFVPARTYAITDSGYCGIGLVLEIVEYLKTLTIPFDISFNGPYIDLVNQLGVCTPGNIAELESEYKLRDYQTQAVGAALSSGYGIIELATGGGKTLIIANLVFNILNYINVDEKILIVVPDIGLVEQTYKDFCTYNFPGHLVCKWSGHNKLNYGSQVIIANMSILQSDNSDLSWFKDVGVLIVDECHKLRRGNKICRLLDKIPTLRRFGFTGTLPENDIDKWNIYNYIGPLIYKKTTTDLRNLAGGEYIANAQALALHIQYKNHPDYTSVSSMQKYRLELDFIYNNSFRFKVINRIVAGLKNNCLILVDHIDHGLRMLKELENLDGKQVYFIQGSVEVEDRQKVQQLMEQHDNVVCIAISKIFSTGISIKNIHYIMFAAGGKAKIKILQSIGRGLRTNENKSILTLIDIADDLIYGKNHYARRQSFYDIEKIKTSQKTITEG